jgi:enoyl-CoA hydratase/carnithine racemase
MEFTRFENYRDRYACARLERTDGILEITLHSDGRDLLWDLNVHEELGYLFQDVGQDVENKVIIITGTGESFISKEGIGGPGIDAKRWLDIHFDGRRLLMSQIDVAAPMIAAINGPATIHAEIALLCDITLACETAYFSDAVHLPRGVAPGDGVQVVWPFLIGINRARYLLLTGGRITAQEALALGVVNEVLPADRLLDRARLLARAVRAGPDQAMRVSRTLFLQQVRAAAQDGASYGLALEALANLGDFPQQGQ